MIWHELTYKGWYAIKAKQTKYSTFNIYELRGFDIKLLTMIDMT